MLESEVFLTNPIIEEKDEISAIVCVKNRTNNLLKSLYSWLKIPKITEIIILDFGSEIPVKIPHLSDRIKLYRYESKFWHLTKAYNIASQLSTKNIIMKLDADYYLDKFFLTHNKLPKDKKSFVCGKIQKPWNLCGFLFVHRENFFAVNGYNERIINYGYDDYDIYIRLESIGLKRIFLNSDFITHLPHDESNRTLFQPQKHISKHNSNKNNKKIAIEQPWTHKDKMSSYYD